MKIKNAENFFKIHVSAAFNKSTVIKVWAKNAVPFLEIDDVKLECVDTYQENGKCVSSFLLNKFYKAQIAESLRDFAVLNFNFTPFFLVKENGVELVCDVENEYSFESKNILSLTRHMPDYKNVVVNFQANWNFLNNEVKSGQDTIKTYSVKKLKNKLPLRGQHKKVRILNFDVHEKSVQWHDLYGTGMFFGLQTCELDYLLRYNFTIARKETLSFVLNKIDENESSDSPKILNYKLRLPDKAIASDWMPGMMYQEDDIVFYKESAYKCKEQHFSFEFFDSKWEAIDAQKYLSFNNTLSFFDSMHGKDCIKKITQAMPLVIESHIAPKIHLKIFTNTLPNLNEFFVHDGVKFRIIEFEYDYANGKHVVEIFGTKILQGFEIEKKENMQNDYVDDEYFEEEDELHWENSAQIPKHDIRTFSADGADQVFEGISIRTPENFEMTSKAKLNMRGSV